MYMESNVFGYKIAMALANEMLNQGIITEKDYGKIDTIMAKKYGLNSYSIFRDKKPISLDNKTF